jgi:hypothetical protein
MLHGQHAKRRAHCPAVTAMRYRRRSFQELLAMGTDALQKNELDEAVALLSRACRTGSAFSLAATSNARAHSRACDIRECCHT